VDDDPAEIQRFEDAFRDIYIVGAGGNLAAALETLGDRRP
jgi:hypothetical protein